jgi:pyruvate dehydrogenase E1 component beta subunit
MPATVADARDLLIASVLCPDPVIFIDDRWLYDLEDDLPPVVELSLASEQPQCLRAGEDMTIVASGYSTRLAMQVAVKLEHQGVFAEVIDLRILNPFSPDSIVVSFSKTGRLLVLDGGWGPCGMAGEVIASVIERVPPATLKKSPVRVTLPFSPAPTSGVLEKAYYPTEELILSQALNLMDKHAEKNF